MNKNINNNRDIKKPIKLMFAVSLYEINGACAVAKNLIDNLDRQRFKIVLMAEQIGEHYFQLDQEIKLINLDLKPQRGLIKKILNILDHIYKIRKTILAEKPDIVLSFCTDLNCFILLSLTKSERKNIKVIITEHSEGLFINYCRPYLKDKIFRKIYKLMMYLFYRRADCIIAVSKNIAQGLIRLLKRRKKIKVIYNPVNILKIKKLSEEVITDFNFEKNIPYIAIVSRLSREKGVSHLIESFTDLCKRIESRLLIMGDGEEREVLEALTRRYKIEDKVKFIGWQENPFKYLKNAEVFVLSSIYEGFPNVMLESMACGVPVVTLKSGGGIEEIIDDGIDGILVKSRDPLILSEAICNLLINKELREKIVVEAYKKVNRFEVSKIVKEYESTLTKLMSNNLPPVKI